MVNHLVEGLKWHAGPLLLIPYKFLLRPTLSVYVILNPAAAKGKDRMCSALLRPWEGSRRGPRARGPAPAGIKVLHVILSPSNGIAEHIFGFLDLLKRLLRSRVLIRVILFR